MAIIFTVGEQNGST